MRCLQHNWNNWNSSLLTINRQRNLLLEISLYFPLHSRDPFWLTGRPCSTNKSGLSDSYLLHHSHWIGCYLQGEGWFGQYYNAATEFTVSMRCNLGWRRGLHGWCNTLPNDTAKFWRQTWFLLPVGDDGKSWSWLTVFYIDMCCFSTGVRTMRGWNL